MKTVLVQKKPATPRPPVAYLPLELIVDHPDLGNREIDKEFVSELKESIRTSGLDVPLAVWTGGEEFPSMQIGSKTYPSSWLVAGAHRRAALKMLRKEDADAFAKLFPNGIPVHKFDGTLKDMLCHQLRENVARKNPTAEELLPKVIRLRDEFNMKNKVIAARIGKSDSYVTQLFSIEKELGEEGVEEVIKGKVSAKDAMRAAAKVKAERKAGKSPNVKRAVASAAKKTAARAESGRERDEKRVSFKKLYKVYKSLPEMEAEDKLDIAEKLMAYVAGERDNVPRELKLAMTKPSKTEDEDESDEEESEE